METQTLTIHNLTKAKALAIIKNKISSDNNISKDMLVVKSQSRQLLSGQSPTGLKNKYLRVNVCSPMYKPSAGLFIIDSTGWTLHLKAN